MCTAATYKTKCFYFGRNLDYERGFGEQVVITPRLFPCMPLQKAIMPSRLPSSTA